VANCYTHRYVSYTAVIPTYSDGSEGVPHLLMEDDEYDGFFIPKGTIVVGSTW